MLLRYSRLDVRAYPEEGLVSERMRFFQDADFTVCLDAPDAHQHVIDSADRCTMFLGRLTQGVKEPV